LSKKRQNKKIYIVKIYKNMKKKFLETIVALLLVGAGANFVTAANVFGGRDGAVLIAQAGGYVSFDNDDYYGEGSPMGRGTVGGPIFRADDEDDPCAEIPGVTDVDLDQDGECAGIDPDDGDPNVTTFCPSGSCGGTDNPGDENDREDNSVPVGSGILFLLCGVTIYGFTIFCRRKKETKYN
jgi:hypothetical protein